MRLQPLHLCSSFGFSVLAASFVVVVVVVVVIRERNSLFAIESTIADDEAAEDDECVRSDAASLFACAAFIIVVKFRHLFKKNI